MQACSVTTLTPTDPKDPTTQIDCGPISEPRAITQVTQNPATPESLQARDGYLLATWTTTLRASSVVGRPGDFRPLVLDEQGRLYLYRYWQYEQQLADDLRRRAAHDPPAVDAGRLHDSLARLFPPRHSPDGDWQKIAAAVAALKRFCVIAGRSVTARPDWNASAGRCLY